VKNGHKWNPSSFPTISDKEQMEKAEKERTEVHYSPDIFRLGKEKV